MAGRSLKDRIGVDLGRRLPLEDGIRWAAEHGVRVIDAQTDIAPNALETFDDARCAGVRELLEASGIDFGLHTLSGVNVAEISPFCRDAVDSYMKAYIDLAPKVGAKWIVVHGGYHFTACKTIRMKASIDRLKRIGDYAAERGVLLLLENLNWEPVLAEVNYMPVTPAECMHFFREIDNPAVRWSFTANHAHFLPGSASTNLSMPWISASATRSGWPTITAHTKSTRSPAKAPSISARCSGRSKARDIQAITPMVSAASTTCWPAVTIWSTVPARPG